MIATVTGDAHQIGIGNKHIEIYKQKAIDLIKGNIIDSSQKIINKISLSSS